MYWKSSRQNSSLESHIHTICSYLWLHARWLIKLPRAYGRRRRVNVMQNFPFFLLSFLLISKWSYFFGDILSLASCSAIYILCDIKLSWRDRKKNFSFTIFNGSGRPFSVCVVLLYCWCVLKCVNTLRVKLNIVAQNFRVNGLLKKCVRC